MENQSILNKRHKNKHKKKIKKYKSKFFFLFFITSFIILFIFLLLFFLLRKNKILLESEWKYKPAGNKIKTSWAYNLDPYKIWQEYPRPQLQREEWINLNGPWK